MRLRNGQVAIYLVAVVLAITVLAVMNVSVFLSVRSKNHAMNAGDAAALAVAKYQGELLNSIGADNIAHLKAAIDGDAEKCAEIMERQMRTCFLAPMDGLRIGNAAAERNGVDRKAGECMQKILRGHVIDVRTVFANNTDMYPEPWEGAWGEYADKLETMVGMLGDEFIVGPDTIEFADAWKCFPLLDKLFYEAIAGRNWCWFHFNGEWLFDRDSSNMPRPDFDDPQPRYDSEIYPLHVDFRPFPPLDDPDTIRLVERLADCNADDLAGAALLSDPEQKWAFFDSEWRHWYEMDPLDGDGLPVVGRVKPQYDVRGCAAVCRVLNSFANLVSGGEGEVAWTAAAKPFGSVENLDGDVAVVTSLKELVVPAFTDVKLVPIDAVGGMELSTADYAWMEHVRKHLPVYFSNGPYATGSDCFYCTQLRRWENPMFRASGKSWLKYNSGSCSRPGGPGYAVGGTSHAH